MNNSNLEENLKIFFANIKILDEKDKNILKNNILKHIDNIKNNNSEYNINDIKNYLENNLLKTSQDLINFKKNKDKNEEKNLNNEDIINNEDINYLSNNNNSFVHDEKYYLFYKILKKIINDIEILNKNIISINNRLIKFEKD